MGRWIDPWTVRVTIGKRIIAAAIVALAVLTAAPANSSGPITSTNLLNYLEQSIQWYRRVQTVEQSGNDLLLRESVLNSSLKVVQLSFAFARAEAPLAESTGAAAVPNAGSGELDQAAQRASDRVAGIQSRITALDEQIRKAPAGTRASLEQQRAELNADLTLATQIQSTVQTLLKFNGSLGSGADGLATQIDELARSVPEAQPETAAAPAKSQSAAQTFQPEASGIVGLTGELFTLGDRRKQVSDLLKQTDALIATIDRLRAPVVNQIRTLIQQADTITNAPPAKTPAEAQAAQQQLARLTTQFKQLSASLVPLSEQSTAAAGTREELQETINDLTESWERTGRYLLLRGIMLGGAIFLILVISSIWRHATFRYVTDPRRRRQFLTVRRIVVSGAVLFALVIGFVTEFGSLATYAGFVTAGIAVALQNPILAVVAYFFLIGRYGVRVGDRVTISGVTGEVLEIGLVRIYMMELGPDGHSTGRIVVFSNSVIFQPSALFKQMPGLDYAWHTAALILSGKSDFKLAEAKLTEAVDSVYREYRGRLERQHLSLQQATDISVATPQPESRLRFTDAGLEFTVRYPVVRGDAAATDDQILNALHDAVAHEPKLEFAPSGQPKVQMAA